MQKLLTSLFIGLLVGCGHSGSNRIEDPLSARSLRIDTLHFVQKTMLTESSGGSGTSSGGFSPGVYESSGFWPATPLVLPARAAAYLNENFGATNGFTYQSFEFASTGCSADNAFGRYFSAIETLGGKSLSQSEKDQIQGQFSDIFTDGDSPEIQAAVCMFYNLIACIADYAVHNQAVLRQAAASGNFEPIFTGAASCVAEVIGTDNRDPEEFVQ